MNKLKQVKIALLVSGLILMSAPILHAEPKVAVRSQKYQVEGSTLKELSESMKRNAPAAVSEHLALTEWSIAWNYKSKSSEAGCVIASAAVTVEVVQLMPDWPGEQSADKKTRKRWRKFIKNLQVHEDGHKQIGIEAAAAMEKAMNRIGTAQDCAQIESLVNQAGQTVITEYKAKETEYDTRTRHGLRQGAKLKYVIKKENANAGE